MVPLRVLSLLLALALSSVAALSAEEPQAEPKEEQAKSENAETAETTAPAKVLELPVVLPGEKQPFEMIRELETLQDRIADGNRSAHNIQREHTIAISDELMRVRDELWKDPRNVRAALVFALSGGDPRILTKLQSLAPLPGLDEDLVNGLIFYSQGKNDEALKLLSKFDPKTLSPSLGGRLSLAQATLLANSMPEKALEYLDIARLLAPGTLVEEAALRRQVELAAGQEKFNRFEGLSSQYARRYWDSIYAEDFRRRFATAVVNSKYARDPKLLASLAQALSDLGADKQRAIYFATATAGVVRGAVELTQYAAGRAEELAGDDKKLAETAKLYKAATLLVSRDFDAAVQMLKEIDRSQIDAGDITLLDAALKLSTQLRIPPNPIQIAGVSPQTSAAQADNANAIEEEALPPVIKIARKMISTADELLNGVGG